MVYIGRGERPAGGKPDISHSSKNKQGGMKMVFPKKRLDGEYSVDERLKSCLVEESQKDMENEREKSVAKALHMLGVEPLLELDNGQRERYLTAVKSFTGANKKLDSLEKICIDRTGYSPEVAAVFGENYLGNRIIVVSAGQKDAGLANRQYSFLGKFVDEMFSSDCSKLFEQVTPIEALIGAYGITVKTGEKGVNVGCYLESLNRTSEKCSLMYAGEDRTAINVRLDTPGKSISRMKEVKAKLGRVDGDSIDTYLSDNTFLMECCRELAPLNDLYGRNSINKLALDSNIAGIPLKESFKFLSGKSTAYVLLGENPFIVYTGKKQSLDNKTSMEVLHIPEEQAILDKLMAYRHIKWDIETAREWMRKMVVAGFVKADVTEEQLYHLVSNTMSFYQFLGKNSDVRKNLDPRWFRLRDVLYPSSDSKSDVPAIEQAFSRLEPELKWGLVRLTSEDEMIKEIFGQLTPQEGIEVPYSRELIDKAQEMLANMGRRKAEKGKKGNTGAMGGELISTETIENLKELHQEAEKLRDGRPNRFDDAYRNPA